MAEGKINRLLGEKDYSVSLKELSYVCQFMDRSEFEKNGQINFEISMLLSEGGGPITLIYDSMKQSLYNLVDEKTSKNPIDPALVQTNSQLHFVKSTCAAFFVIKSRELIMGPRFEDLIYDKYLSMDFDKLIKELKEIHNDISV